LALVQLEVLVQKNGAAARIPEIKDNVPPCEPYSAVLWRHDVINTLLPQPFRLQGTAWQTPQILR
jgi:hypothetical protein